MSASDFKKCLSNSLMDNKSKRGITKSKIIVGTLVAILLVYLLAVQFTGKTAAPSNVNTVDFSLSLGDSGSLHFTTMNVLKYDERTKKFNYVNISPEKKEKIFMALKELSKVDKRVIYSSTYSGSTYKIELFGDSNINIVLNSKNGIIEVESSDSKISGQYRSSDLLSILEDK